MQLKNLKVQALIDVVFQEMNHYTIYEILIIK